MELTILQLRKTALIYLVKGTWPTFAASGEIAEVKSVLVSPRYVVRVTTIKELGGLCTPRERNQIRTAGSSRASSEWQVAIREEAEEWVSG